MKKRIISLMLILCMMLSCGAISAFAQAKSSDTVTFFFHCSSDFTTDGTVRCVLTPKDNILESEIIYGIKSINNFYRFTIPEFSSYCWFTIDNGVDAQYEADPDVNVTDAFVIAGSGAVYSHDGDKIVDINDKIYTNYAIHWADFRYYYGLGDWMEYDPWLRFHRHLFYTSNRNFECRTTDFYYWFKYKELYTFNNNVLTFGTDGKITEEASYGVYGDYVMRNHESYSPSVSGYNVYRSTKPDSGFRKINETPIPSSENCYFDYNETAKTRTYYYYRVLTVNSLEQGNEYSETKSGYGSLTPEQYMREYNKTAINSQTKLTLMHKSNDMDKLGSETAKGAISGTLSYNAKIDGLGARITMHYDNYADFYIEDKNESSGVYFLITGDTNTSANMSANGSMDGVVTCKGMYPGSVSYNNIQIKGGAAGGGTYGIKRDGFDGQIEVDWKIGEEGR